MANLRPFRDYDEKDVINLFTLDTSSVTPDVNDMVTWDTRVTKGTLVQLSTAGWHNSDELEMIGSAGDFAVSGVTSQRYGVASKVEVAQANGRVLGMMLYDMAIVDENGEQLKFNPRKASELEAVIPGQAVPIVTRGMFLLESHALAQESFNAGARLTVAANGDWTSANIATETTTAASDHLVGIALGSGFGTAAAATAAGDLVLVKLDINHMQ